RRLKQTHGVARSRKEFTMPAKTALPWTHRTWNPAVIACTHVSDGCQLCYADVLHTRHHHALLRQLARWYWAVLLGCAAEEAQRALVHTPLQYLYPFDQPQRMKTFFQDVLGRPELARKRLLWPLSVQQPSLIFVDSMTDLFHQVVPEEDIVEVFAVMR